MIRSLDRSSAGLTPSLANKGRRSRDLVAEALGQVEACISGYFKYFMLHYVLESPDLAGSGPYILGFSWRLGRKGGKQGSAAARSNNNTQPDDFGSTVEGQRLEYRRRS